jgi:inorganic pyrophosphatase
MDIAPRAAAGLVHVVIDTPQGSRNKYKYDEATGLFKLSRMLPAGMHFPCDFGAIPGTRAEDGDALDVAVLSDAAAFAGCLLTVKLIGIIGAWQREHRRRIKNDRLVAVPVTPVNEAAFHDMADVSADRIEGIEQFFAAYNRAQGREFRLTGRRGPAAAERALRAGIRAHDRTVKSRRS